MATLHIGPQDINPDRARGQNQYFHAVGAQTAVLVSAGGGDLHSIVVGVVGTLAEFYDTPSGGTADATTKICTVSLAALTVGPLILDIAFSKGLTCIITGGASTEVSGSFNGAQTTSSRTFP